MMRTRSSKLLLLSLLALPLLPGPSRPALAAKAPATIRRFALIVGANHGGGGRVRLRYAHSDARAVAKVIGELGGVAPADRKLLLEPNRLGLRAALHEVRGRIEKVRGKVRTELLFYYSGHSDERGLLLRGEHFTYLEVRQAIASMPADVRIAVLDSCASGSLTRTKGGRRRPPFLVDSSGKVRGHAYLTSASADEAAQESDRVRGSFFTHYLVAGLRGAADANRDSRVTLNEAYHHAFHETLARTESTRAGAQHPNYDMQLAGSGDLVLTDLRGTSAQLVLAAGLRGRLFIRDAAGRLVLEVNKTSARPMVLGLAEGRYTVALEQGKQIRRAKVALTRRTRAVVDGRSLTLVDRELAVARGGPPRPPVATPAPPPPRRYLLRKRFIRVPVTLTLAPFITTGGTQVETNVSLGLVASHYGRLRGFDIALGASIATEEVHGAQISLGFNTVGHLVRGAQVTLGMNRVGGDLRGAQVALGFNAVGTDLLAGAQVSLGFNITGRDMLGVQGTLGFNWAGGDVDGAQVALGVNVARGVVDGAQVALGLNVNRVVVDGAQVALGFNTAREIDGLQLSTGINQANRIRGAQVGLINIGGLVQGTQIGLINIGGHVTAAQVGLINIAGRSDVPIGLLNIVRDGVHDLEVWTTDAVPLNVGLKLGGCNFYSVFALGLQPRHDAEDRWLFGLGFGGRAALANRVFLDIDAVAHHINEGYWTHDINVLATGRIGLSFQLARFFGIFAGASFNTHVTRLEDDGFGLIKGKLVHRNNGLKVRLWPGFFAGIRI